VYCATTKFGSASIARARIGRALVTLLPAAACCGLAAGEELERAHRLRRSGSLFHARDVAVRERHLQGARVRHDHDGELGEQFAVRNGHRLERQHLGSRTRLQLYQSRPYRVVAAGPADLAEQGRVGTRNLGGLDHRRLTPRLGLTEGAETALVELNEGRVLGESEGDDLSDALTDPAIVGRQRARVERRDEHHAGLDRGARRGSERHQRGQDPQDPEDHRGSRVTHRSAPFQGLDANERE